MVSLRLLFAPVFVKVVSKGLETSPCHSVFASRQLTGGVAEMVTLANRIEGRLSVHVGVWVLALPRTPLGHLAELVVRRGFHDGNPALATWAVGFQFGIACLCVLRPDHQMLADLQGLIRTDSVLTLRVGSAVLISF